MPSPDHVHLSLALAGTLAHGLGIDYSDRLNGLDDLRRYVRLLDEAIQIKGLDCCVQDLADQVEETVRDQPFRRCDELWGAIGVVAALEPLRSVRNLCHSMTKQFDPASS